MTCLGEDLFGAPVELPMPTAACDDSFLPRILEPVFQSGNGPRSRRKYKMNLNDLYRTKCGGARFGIERTGIMFNAVNGYLQVSENDYPVGWWNDLTKLKVTDYLRLGGTNSSTCFLNGRLKKKALMEIQLQSAPISAISAFGDSLGKLMGLNTMHTFASIRIDNTFQCSIGAYQSPYGGIALVSPDKSEVSMKLFYPSFKGGIKSLTYAQEMSPAQVRLFISMIELMIWSQGHQADSFGKVPKQRNVDVSNLVCTHQIVAVNLKYSLDFFTMRKKPSRQAQCVRSLSKTANCQTYGNMFFYNPDLMVSLLDESSLNVQRFDFDRLTRTQLSETWEVPQTAQCVDPGVGRMRTTGQQMNAFL